MWAKSRRIEEFTQEQRPIPSESQLHHVVFEIGRIRYIVIPQSDLPLAVGTGGLISDGQCAGMLMIENVPYVVTKDNPAVSTDRDPAEMLTGRELQIARLVALGHCTKRIADILHISEWTVSTHLRRVFAKLNVDSRAAMVYRCGTLLNRSEDSSCSTQNESAGLTAR